MNIPTIPTDSLYKFLAILGLLSLLTFISAPMYFLHKAELQVIKTTGDYEIVQNNVSYNTDDIKLLTDEINIAHKNNKRLDSNILALKKRVKEINRKNSKDNIMLKTKIKLINNYNDLVGTIIVVSTFGAIISFIAMLVGFYLWYIKIQKPLDMQMSQLQNNRINGVRLD